jgi:hypothetical protein
MIHARTERAAHGVLRELSGPTRFPLHGCGRPAPTINAGPGPEQYLPKAGEKQYVGPAKRNSCSLGQRDRGSDSFRRTVKGAEQARKRAVME